MRIDAVQVADHVDVKRAAPQRPAPLALVAEMLVQHRVLQFAEGVLLRDQPLCAFDIAGAQHARRQADDCVNDQAKIIKRRLFLELNSMLSLAFALIRSARLRWMISPACSRLLT